jgi:hypothetical protein
MQLYTGTPQQFVEDATHDQITEKLEKAFAYHFGHKVARSEARSWENSLLRMGVVLKDADLLYNGVILACCPVWAARPPTRWEKHSDNPR